MDMDNLLPELSEGKADLLPTGTLIFPSRNLYTPKVWWTVGVTIVAVLLLVVFSALSGHEARTLSYVFGYAAFLLLILGLVFSVWMAVQDMREYQALIKSGGWLQGIFVFPSGDVVIRIQLPLGGHDRTIEAINITDACVESAFSWWSCKSNALCVTIRFLDENGIPQRVNVDGWLLVDSAADIAQCIHEKKWRGDV